MYINMIYYCLFTNLASHNCVLYNTLIKYYDYRFDMFIQLEQGREVGHLCDFVHLRNKEGLERNPREHKAQ